ncbi:MAG: chromate resistance protein [Nitrospirota bacterium]|nr:chromate resistance protein [Nitrospirota bacterium]
MPKRNNQEWLLVFYSVPAHPVSARMKIWRKLAKAGAVQLKGAVYLLPASDEHEELLQWLIGEVRSMGGDGAFVRTAEIRTMAEADIRSLFLQQTEQEISKLEKDLVVVERKVQSFRKGTKPKDAGSVVTALGKIVKEYEGISRRDFFSSHSVGALKKRLQAAESGLKSEGAGFREVTAPIALRRVEDYQRRIWATRKNPFVDRMASAWLIQRFIDAKAAFRFVDEKEVLRLGPGMVAFDVHGGEFTHHGELCTFEVLVKAFGIKDKAVSRIAEIVHDLDLKDDKYQRPETTGVEDILAGIRRTAKDDADGLERGMAVFEMLYRSRS